MSLLVKMCRTFRILVEKRENTVLKICLLTLFDWRKHSSTQNLFFESMYFYFIFFKLAKSKFDRCVRATRGDVSYPGRNQQGGCQSHSVKIYFLIEYYYLVTIYIFQQLFFYHTALATNVSLCHSDSKHTWKATLSPTWRGFSIFYTQKTENWLLMVFVIHCRLYGLIKLWTREVFRVIHFYTCCLFYWRDLLQLCSLTDSVLP